MFVTKQTVSLKKKSKKKKKKPSQRQTGNLGMESLNEVEMGWMDGWRTWMNGG